MEQALAPVAEAPILRSAPQHPLPLETLAQSISTIAPTTSPTMTVPLVFALAGNGTWLAYLLATVAILLIALCISRFASYTSCSGSLYTYATSSLPPIASSIAGWALFLAYIATGAAVAGGFINYANVFLLAFFGRTAPTTLLGTPLRRASPPLSPIATSRYPPVSCSGSKRPRSSRSPSSSRSSSGATAPTSIRLNSTSPESRPQPSVSASSWPSSASSALRAPPPSATKPSHPLRTIPRAVIQMRHLLRPLLHPLRLRRNPRHGMPPTRTSAIHRSTQRPRQPRRRPCLGPLIDFGALVSMFACTLACITAAARVLMRMAHNGLVHHRLGTAHHKNATPASRSFVTGPAHRASCLCPRRTRHLRNRHLRLDGLALRLRIHHHLRPRRHSASHLPQAQPPPHARRLLRSRSQRQRRCCSLLRNTLPGTGAPPTTGSPTSISFTFSVAWRGSLLDTT